MKKSRAGHFQKKVPNKLYHILNSTQSSAEIPHFCNIKERQFQNLFVVLSSTTLFFTYLFARNSCTYGNILLQSNSNKETSPHKTLMKNHLILWPSAFL